VGMARGAFTAKVTDMKWVRFRVLAGVAIGIFALGFGLVAADVIPISSGPASGSPTPAATKAVPPDPDIGLSDAERNAKYEATWNEFQARRKEWIEGLDLAGLDLRSLPRYDNSGDSLPGESDLASAVSRAEVIVVGDVTDIKPTVSGGTRTTLAVKHVLKGGDFSSLEMAQASTLEPTLDWKKTEISDVPAAPLLLPGDRAILFLVNSPIGYVIPSPSGWYQVVGGIVNPGPLNPFASEIEGLSEAGFAERVSAAVKRGQ